MNLIQLSIIGFIIAFGMQQFGKTKVAFWILMLTGAFIYISAAMLDPFLNLWDERFHALVAKNMMSDPFQPMLYNDPVLDMEYFPWDRYHIWLHKQPLFLWQIAIAFKLFGVNEFSLRIPNIVMSVLLIPIAYRAGKLLINQKVGFYAASLLVSSYYLIDLSSGRRLVDHNDVAFLFYVSASIWAWLEYLYSKRRKVFWIILTGVFSGFAILVKWLPGLLVYLAWGIFNLIKYKFKFRKYTLMLISLAITFLVAAPWQIYTYINFPAEKALEMAHYSDHFLIAVEGHAGDFLYYYNNINVLFGQQFIFLIIPGLIISFIKIKELPLKVSFLVMPVFVYLFFSIANTKMPSFPFMLAMVIFIAIAILVYYIEENIVKFLEHKTASRITMVIFLTFIVFHNLNFDYLNAHHNPDLHHYQILKHNKEVFKKLKNDLPENAVIFNVPGRHYVECMFYSDLPAYPLIPTEEQINEIILKNRKVAIFYKPDLAAYLQSNTDLILIKDEINKYD